MGVIGASCGEVPQARSARRILRSPQGKKGRIMARRITSLFAGLGLAVLLGGALAGCATDAGDPGAATDPTDGAATEIEVDGAWLEGGHAIGVITQGSSTCVPTVSDVSLGADGVVAVTLVDAGAEYVVCTRDMVPRVSLASLPEGVDATKDLTVDVTWAEASGSVTLPGIPALEPTEPNVEGTPSAGWTSVNGEFVIVTYGSSSCPEIVENTEVSGDAAVTVTFATPPADKVCTADFAPRAVLAFADGLADQPNVTLSLTGGGVADTDIPILGANYVAIPVG